MQILQALVDPTVDEGDWVCSVLINCGSVNWVPILKDNLEESSKGYKTNEFLGNPVKRATTEILAHVPRHKHGVQVLVLTRKGWNIISSTHSVVYSISSIGHQMHAYTPIRRTDLPHAVCEWESVHKHTLYMGKFVNAQEYRETPRSAHSTFN